MINHLSEETKEKISKALKGRKKPPFTKEHRRKLREYLKAHPIKFWIGRRRVHSEATKKKMSLSTHGFLVRNIPWNKNKKGVKVAWNKGLKGFLSKENHWNW